MFPGANGGAPGDHAFTKHAADAVCPPPTGVQRGGLFIPSIRLPGGSRIYGRRVCRHAKGTDVFERFWACWLAGPSLRSTSVVLWLCWPLSFPQVTQECCFCAEDLRKISRLNLALIIILSLWLLCNSSNLRCTFRNPPFPFLNQSLPSSGF